MILFCASRRTTWPWRTAGGGEAAGGGGARWQAEVASARRRRALRERGIEGATRGGRGVFRAIAPAGTSATIGSAPVPCRPHAATSAIAAIPNGRDVRTHEAYVASVMVARSPARADLSRRPERSSEVALRSRPVGETACEQPS